jgi:cell wall-associated NlpC family hydrolase
MELLLLPGLVYLLSVALKTATTKNALTNILNKYQGTPYKWGGTTPNGFDCSGFTQYVYKNYFGKNIPRVAKDQAAAATITNTPAPGDLVFFAPPGTNNITHVGIFYDQTRFIHSGSTNGVEMQTFNNPYWAARLKFYGKL